MFAVSPVLTEPVDVYHHWIDACDAAEAEVAEERRPAASSSRAAPPINYGSDDD